jgi:hypothetical protein
MRRNKPLIGFYLVISFGMMIIVSAGWADMMYNLDMSVVESHKAFYDDPRPIYKDLSFKKVLPPDVYKKITFDAKAMEKQWAEVVGFKSPDIVGKIGPDLKPGKYSYKDKDKYPALKELMIPEIYRRFDAGGKKPLPGNYPEITVVPTRQYYYALPIAEATLKNIGKVKQDAQGYMDYSTCPAGFPFPRPEGPMAGIQVMYDWEKRYINGENYHIWMHNQGITKDFDTDYDPFFDMNVIKVEGRAVIEPFGWLDVRAKEQGEARVVFIKWNSPRDLYGNAYQNITYLDRDRDSLNIIYINAMRRTRKLSGTDTQDKFGGQDMCYEDGDGFNQKMTPSRFPYKYEVIGEREFLLPAYTLDGSGSRGSKDKAYYGYEFERRPMYVVKLTQLDPNFVYSYRIMYIDKETFIINYAEYYDQKGRLYRTALFRYFFEPEMGQFFYSDGIYLDHVDYHATVQKAYIIPAPLVGREQVSIKAMTLGK